MTDDLTQPLTGEMTKITMIYRNYRGEVGRRTIIPLAIWFGHTEFHPDPQWLLTAFDVEKKAQRDFALRDCQFAQPVAQEPVAFMHRWPDGNLAGIYEFNAHVPPGVVVTPLYAHPAAPAPVEVGLREAMERLTTDICIADGDRAAEEADHADGSERIDLWPHTYEFHVDDVRVVLAALRAQSAPVSGEGGAA